MSNEGIYLVIALNLKRGDSARIGEATVLPGDVVLGTIEGVIFIPPHLAQEVVETSENIRLRDEFGQQRIREGVYTPGEVDRPFSEAMEWDFQEWLASRR